MRNLLEFLSKSGHWLLFVFLEVISLVLLFQYNSYQGSVWITSANAVTGRIYEWESAVEAFFSLTRINEGLTMRNFYLERQVDQLSRLYTEATDDTTAAERYGLKLLEQYELIPAKVVSNSLHREDNLITINRGRADGVRTDMGVACGLGVVGVVYMVSEHYSIVMPVLNVNSRVSCTIRKRGYFGYLRWSGGDPTVAYVEDIPRHAHFKRGDWVETNGYSSIFPQGVPAGKIIQVYNSSDGLSYRLKVRLATDFGNLRDVYVLSDKSIAERAGLMEAARDSLREKGR
ncbi:rod shape-determining protein MreC [Xylanibacter rodentium]|uniref:Cell shape-determining protein MreC n=1 Tax=Xylanibacter rodentium TaxID=2736289 RepID=A0ABX2AYT6_9BACT|nr:rod shape-determining protein MreC [Xylanibacter rodentium]NPE12607.1 rod shape-determining protein MreC [Prevotella sp. PJ1A]NPE15098.1 rod shape-determining protein MreC [Xylanibacter rodentium]NPE40037.1 rod shape-determining protein MreC [Prevotella sp. PCJ2]